MRELALCLAPQLTDQGLLGLAALTGLTKLRVLACPGLSAAIPRNFGRGCFLVFTKVGASLLKGVG